jgi:hypothetical protein
MAWATALAYKYSNHLFICKLKCSKSEYDQRAESLVQRIAIDLDNYAEEQDMAIFRRYDLSGFFYKIFEQETQRLERGGELRRVA